MHWWLLPVKTAATLLLAALLSGCAARSATAVAPSPAATADARERLRQNLDAIFNSPAAAHAQWAISVFSLRTAETLYRLDGARFMIPASGQKLLTSAAAAEGLGWDYRFTTRVLSTAPPGPDGRIDGDLIIVGSGDPSINPRHPDRWRVFDDWALTLESKGVKTISGRLVGDDNAFAEPGWGFGWSWDDLHLGYGAEPSALQYHENQVAVIVGPGMAAGSAAIVASSPFGGDLVIDHSVTTVASGEQTALSMRRMPGTPYLTVRGQIAEASAPVTLLASVANPTRFYLEGVREAFARHGIQIEAGVVDIDDVRSPVARDSLVELVIDRSPPLSELVDVTLKWSRNIYAESLLLALALHSQPATSEAALPRLRATLRKWGIAPESYLARDGSGLSRYDYVTADALIGLLTHMWMDPAHAENFAATLPVSGRSGTLANRMKGTPAEGRVRAKTGTMSNVRSLCGYVTTHEGEPLAFAMLANDFQIAAGEIEAFMDRALQTLVQFSRPN
jgi:D-alanyl-D-alanine carboxypeptidase/D-alanyl-D-alanine-endopeptidase (penicillin-binding protein 4)